MSERDEFDEIFESVGILSPGKNPELYGDHLSIVEPALSELKAKLRERDERVAREARLTACSNTLEDVSKILTGSDDFKISPGVELGLGIGQIRTLRAALSTLERTYKAQLKPNSEESE